MSLSTDDIIKIKCSGLYSDANKSLWVQLATEKVSAGYFGSNYNEAVALLACHEWTLSNRIDSDMISGVGGMVTSIREGDLSIGFGKAGSGSGIGDLEQTTFGLQFKNLIQNCGMGISVIGNGLTTEQ